MKMVADDHGLALIGVQITEFGLTQDELPIMRHL